MRIQGTTGLGKSEQQAIHRSDTAGLYAHTASSSDSSDFAVPAAVYTLLATLGIRLCKK